MDKIIKMKWPKLGKEVKVRLLTDINLEVCDRVLFQLPVKSIQSHAAVCGKQMYCPYAFTDFPKNMIFEDMSKQQIGRVNLELNFQYLSVNYGIVNEAVPALAIGQVMEEDIYTIKEVGYQMWNNLLFSNDYIEVLLEKE